METINEPRISYREFFLETAFQRAHNSWKHQTAQLSPMQFNSDWEETLNDIDELIQSELGCSLSVLSPYDAAHLSNKIESRESYTPFKTKTSSSDPSKWNLSGKFVTLKVIGKFVKRYVLPHRLKKSPHASLWDCRS